MRHIFILLLIISPFCIFGQSESVDTTDLLHRIYYNSSLGLEGSFELRLSKVVLHTHGWNPNNFFMDPYVGISRDESSYTEHRISEMIDIEDLEIYKFEKENFIIDYANESVSSLKSTDFKRLWGPIGGDPASIDFKKRVNRYVQQQFGEKLAPLGWLLDDFSKIHHTKDWAIDGSKLTSQDSQKISDLLNLRNLIHKHSSLIGSNDFNKTLLPIKFIADKFAVIDQNEFILERQSINYPFYQATHRLILTDKLSQKIVIPIMPINGELYLVLSYEEILQFSSGVSSYPVNNDSPFCRYFYDGEIKRDCNGKELVGDKFWRNLQPDNLYHFARKRNKFITNSGSNTWKLFETKKNGYYISPYRMQFLFKLHNQ